LVDNNEGVFIQTNKWRPFYYDMFNRVGNLTVLSLSKRRNAIIENLHTYRNKSNTWHDRQKRKFPEEDFSDFASVRIYWKYPETSETVEPGVNYGPPSNKGFYMFSQDKVLELEKYQYDKVLPILSRRVQEAQIERQLTLEDKQFKTDEIGKV